MSVRKWNGLGCILDATLLSAVRRKRDAWLPFPIPFVTNQSCSSLIAAESVAVANGGSARDEVVAQIPQPGCDRNCGPTATFHKVTGASARNGARSFWRCPQGLGIDAFRGIRNTLRDQSVLEPGSAVALSQTSVACKRKGRKTRLGFRPSEIISSS
jgi:hypothetical protein